MKFINDLDRNNKIIVELDDEDIQFINNIINQIYRDISKYDASTILGLRDRILSGYVSDKVFAKYLTMDKQDFMCLVEILGMEDNTITLFLTYNKDINVRVHGVVYL